MESAPAYSVIERGPLVLAMSHRFNAEGDGWFYAAPATNPDGSLALERPCPIAAAHEQAECGRGVAKLGSLHQNGDRVQQRRQPLEMTVLCHEQPDNVLRRQAPALPALLTEAEQASSS